MYILTMKVLYSTTLNHLISVKSKLGQSQFAGASCSYRYSVHLQQMQNVNLVQYIIFVLKSRR